MLRRSRRRYCRANSSDRPFISITLLECNSVYVPSISRRVNPFSHRDNVTFKQHLARSPRITSCEEPNCNPSSLRGNAINRHRKRDKISRGRLSRNAISKEYESVVVVLHDSPDNPRISLLKRLHHSADASGKY